MVANIGDFFPDEYHFACDSSYAFNLLSTVLLQRFTFIPLTVLIDTWYRSAQVIIVRLEQFTQTLCLLSGEFFQLDWLSQTSCRLIRGNYTSYWIFSVSLSLQEGNLIYLNKFLRQHFPFWEDERFSKSTFPHDISWLDQTKERLASDFLVM